MTTYAIGDIQGCHGRLDALLKEIDLVSPEARLIFVGDLVNRGPGSLPTLRRVRELGSRAQVVLGNHDLHLLAVAQGIRKPHPTDTIDDVLKAPDCSTLIDWLRQQPLALMEGGYLLVHAGVVPQWTAEQTLDLAHEVHTALSGPGWVTFLKSMYGNTPARWDDALEGQDRLRCIVNALTRIRFCSSDGTMDLAAKGMETELAGHMPWFDVPGRKSAHTPIVFGHWSTLGLVMRPNLVSLDTGCLWGGKLTAVCLEDRQVIQVDCPQYLRPGSI